MKIRTYKKSELGFFPLYAATIDTDYLQDKTVRPEGYEMDQIFKVNSGEGIIKIGGKTYNLNENDLFYIAKDTSHEYYGITENFYTTFLSFTGDGFGKIREYYNLSDYGIYSNKNKGSFEASVKKLFDVFDATREISELCALTFSTVISFFDEVCKKEYSDIDNVYRFLEENYSKMISLDDILSFYPFSKATLCREFKRKYGMTVFDALIDIRLRRARYMIKSFPELSLKSISVSCGFNDLSYFCKMYKRAYKHSPGKK